MDSANTTQKEWEVCLGFPSTQFIKDLEGRAVVTQEDEAVCKRVQRFHLMTNNVQRISSFIGFRLYIQYSGI